MASPVVAPLFSCGGSNGTSACREFHTRYDANGYRIVKTDNSGQPVISIRTDKGDTLSEFIVKPQATNPQLTKDFIYGLDQLLVERTVTSTAPKMTTNSVLKTGSAYNFKLVEGAGQGSYAVDISASSGWRRELFGIHPDANGVFSIAETELSPDETNFIRVRVESPQASPYSAPVSLVYDTTVTGTSANQIRTISVSRNGSDLILRWSLNQSNGKSTKLYFRRADGAATYVLTPQALPITVTELTLNSQALASPCGGFYGTQFSVGVETGGSRESTLGSDRAGEQGTQDGCGNPQPPQPTPTITFANAYRHLDQLGSLRVATGENGAPTARIDYYPYGQELATSNWSGLPGDGLFAKSDRDWGTGKDYMLARYTELGVGRFLSVDPCDDHSLMNPASWNKFSYVRNNPIGLNDPDGCYAKGFGWSNSEWKRFDKLQHEAAKKLTAAAERLTKAANAISAGGKLDGATIKTMKAFETATGKGNATPEKMLATAKTLESGAKALNAGEGSGYVANGLSANEMQVSTGNPAGPLAAADEVGGTTMSLNLGHTRIKEPMLVRDAIAHEALHHAGLADQEGPRGTGYRSGTDAGALKALRDTSPEKALVNPDSLLGFVF
ncbi:MAG: RHS repeat-associated core domain-containing protein [Acidobacteriota bacterium]